MVLSLRSASVEARFMVSRGPSEGPYAGLVPTRQKGIIVWAESRPSHCPAGHRLQPNQVLIGWLSCQCPYPALGHRTWLCLYIVDDCECGLIIYRPPHDHGRLT